MLALRFIKYNNLKKQCFSAYYHLFPDLAFVPLHINQDKLANIPHKKGVGGYDGCRSFLFCYCVCHQDVIDNKQAIRR
jgi:hypothetical protein